ncbi:MAG: quinolinate synthase NadA [Ruminococcus sp.]|jgi:quinolinate synthase|nr:quinolinate synthase NadA [Ruminococcus sp.]
MLRELQDKILKTKREKGIAILAHSYEAEEIQEVADVVGDSFMLSESARKLPQNTVIMAGVKFMAETVKILSPEKSVILANPAAGCPMAEQFEPFEIEQLKALHPAAAVVAYINTTAELKCIADVCVTSSSAVEICRKLDADEIIFIPDCNLGAFVAKEVPEKKFHLIHGGCPIHAAVSKSDALDMKKLHPAAKIAVHPECQPEVCALADYIGSTSGIMKYCKETNADEFIVGTEISIAEHLQYACPDKKFYILSKKLICPNMKITTLTDVWNSLSGGGLTIKMSDELIKNAGRCIDVMLRLG